MSSSDSEADSYIDNDEYAGEPSEDDYSDVCIDIGSDSEVSDEGVRERFTQIKRINGLLRDKGSAWKEYSRKVIA
jgi:hypothetical protein